MMTVERIYSAEVWAQLVKKKSNYACSQCGECDDVQSTHLTPPSLGGRNTLDNGIALCLRCLAKRAIPSNRVRFNFSVPESLAVKLDMYCVNTGRTINDVVKQLLADFLFDPEVHLNGFHRDAELNIKRISVPILASVYERFVQRCRDLNVDQGNAMKSMLYQYVTTYGGDLS